MDKYIYERGGIVEYAILRISDPGLSVIYESW